MGRNGSKLIGFNSSLCGSNKTSALAAGDQNRTRSSPSPRSVIGFDLIPVIDLNGTVHLLSDDIVPVTTLSGDVIYTTRLALSPLNDSTMTAPLDKYRQQSDPQRKVDKNNVLTGQEKSRAGWNPKNMSSMVDSLTRSGSNMTNTSTATTSSPGKSNLYPVNKSGLSSLSKSASSNQSPSKNDMLSSSKTFNNLPSTPSSSKRWNNLASPQDHNDPGRNIAGGNPSSSSSSGGGGAAGAGSEDLDQDAMDQFLNDVLSPILSSTSLWRSGPTSSSDMVLIPVETGDLFQGDLIIETDDPQDNTLLILDPSSSPDLGPWTGTRQRYDQINDPLPIGIASPDQLRIQDPHYISPSSRTQQITSHKQLSSSPLSSPDQLQESLPPIGIASPELLQNLDPFSVSPKLSDPKQFATGPAFADKELQAPGRLPIGAASHGPLNQQQEEEKSGSWSRDPIMMQDGSTMTGSESPDHDIIMSDQDREDDGVILILEPVQGPRSGSGSGSGSGPRPGLQSISSSIERGDRDCDLITI